MTWRSITNEEFEICKKMSLWLATRKQWRPSENWLPSEADISKSALFERIMNGYDPLPFPPPRGLSCPWYAVVEDKGPHFAGDIFENKQNGFGPYFHIVLPNHNYTNISYEVADVGHQVTIWQNSYWIEERISSLEFIIKDAGYDTAYRFRIWYDPDYKYGSIAAEPLAGGWMIRNVDFDV